MSAHPVSFHFLAGPPACGKGAIGEGIVNTFPERGEHRVCYISTSDLIRDHLKRNTEFGLALRKEQQNMDNGKTLTDEPINGMLCERLEHEIRQGVSIFLVDGYCRSLGQAEQIIRLAQIAGVWFYDVKASFELCESRRADRVRKNGGIFIRQDDRPEVFARRYHDEYQKLWHPAAQAVKKEWPFCETIDASKKLWQRVITVAQNIRFLPSTAENRKFHARIVQSINERADDSYFFSRQPLPSSAPMRTVRPTPAHMLQSPRSPVFAV